jgi:curved DNA-binding protein
MKVPSGAKAGQRMRLAGKGLPRPGGGAGDLYAVLSIEVPNPLTDAEKKLFEELRRTARFNPRTRFGG